MKTLLDTAPATPFAKTQGPSLAIISHVAIASEKLNKITDPEVRAALSQFNLAFSLYEGTLFLTEQPNLKSPGESLSQSQFSSGANTIYLASLPNVMKMSQNIKAASNLALKCSPKVVLEESLTDGKFAVLVLEWPAPITQMVSAADKNPDALDNATLQHDMRKLLDINLFNEYALAGNAHHFIDRTGTYPYIVVNDWSSLRMLKSETEKAEARSLIDNLLKAS